MPSRSATLKCWLAARPPTHGLDQLQHLLDEFRDYYNTRRPHRSLAGRTPATAYAARAKATPDDNNNGHFREREDTIHASGNITLRRAGRLHHIGMGTELGGTPVRMLVHDLHVIVIHSDTGEILQELTIDPDKNYQPRGLKPGPKKGSPRQGGMPNGYKYPPKKDDPRHPIRMT